MIFRRALYLALLLGALSGCSTSPNYAPVVERSGFPQPADGTHRVHSGETLYAIAWRYGLDFRRLAAANNLRSPYTIYPGQTLSLQERAPSAARASRSPSSGGAAARAGTANSGQASQRRTASNTQKTRVAGAAQASRLEAWQWPATGPVMRRFSTASPVHKGIDLRGELGQPVVAANSGQVVYAGNGLVGYGNLIIIKHDDQFLSAYGHNRRILVKEGGKVKAGEKIAEIGDTGTNTAQLHFEVRRSGKPIDPLRILPKR